MTEMIILWVEELALAKAASLLPHRAHHEGGPLKNEQNTQESDSNGLDAEQPMSQSERDEIGEPGERIDVSDIVLAKLTNCRLTYPQSEFEESKVHITTLNQLRLQSKNYPLW